jgi:hypothetical protein
MPGAEVSKHLLHSPRVINHGADPHWIVADGTAQRVNMPDAEDRVSPSLPRKGAKGARREESTMEDIMKLCDVVRETGFAIHQYHKHGHLEKVYENALAHRLRKLGLEVKQEYPLKVYDEDGTLIGDCSADLFVDTSDSTAPPETTCWNRITSWPITATGTCWR